MYDRKESRLIGLGLRKEITSGSVTILSPSEKDFPVEEEIPDNIPSVKLTRMPSVTFECRPLLPKQRLKIKSFEWQFQKGV